MPDTPDKSAGPSTKLEAPRLSTIGSSTRVQAARLKFGGESTAKIRWGYEPLKAHIASLRLSASLNDETAFAENRRVPSINGTRLIQQGGLPPLPEGADEEDLAEDVAAADINADEDASAGPSSSDVGPIEFIPTPRPRPEIKAELIPTPLGIPESKAGSSAPMARIAADPMSKGGKLPTAKTTSSKTTLLPPDAPETESMQRDLEMVGLTSADAAPEDYQTWTDPDAVLFFTGDQHGYIEPCGCTGLDRQKGGVARRFTFMEQLRNRGWDMVPVDTGNQIRRVGQQAAIKYFWSNEALRQMKYEAAGIGPEDIRLSVTELISVVFADDPATAMYQSANVVLLGDSSFIASHKIIDRGKWKIGVTNLLDPDSMETPPSGDIEIKPLKPAAQAVLKELSDANARFKVLTFYGKEEHAKKLVKEVPGFDLVVVSGSYGEPTYRPQIIEGSKTQMIVTGNKGMYVGLVGLFENRPFKYARVALTHDFEDAPQMRKLMQDYQDQLESMGLSDLGLSPIPHPSGESYVGAQACGKCHTEAFAIWEASAHANATESIVKPPKERGDIARHFDPECISCHVTGWNPQQYYPYKTGYLSLDASKHLHGNGCENCHGPGAGHAKAEEPNSGVSEERKKRLRLSMQLPLEKAKEHCMKCHDLDNSPDFHDEDAFEDTYWPDIEHYGME